MDLLARAAWHRRPGPYQIEAAIAAVHAEAATWEATDWPQLLALYTMLEAVDPSPIVTLNRATVAARVTGPEAALAEIDTLSDVLDHYYLYHATRAALLRQLGRGADSRLADQRALERTANTGERSLLEERLAFPICP